MRAMDAAPNPRPDGPATPRIAPLPEADWDERQRGVLEPLLVGRTTNIYTTLVRHPDAAEAMTTLGRTLRSDKLPVRHRETLILRTGWNCGSAYEFSQHRVVAAQAGMTDDDVRRITAGPDAEGWDKFEAVLCRAADEVHNPGMIGDATWAAMARQYDEQQMIQATMLVGYYHLVCTVLRTLGVPLEPGSKGFAFDQTVS